LANKLNVPTLEMLGDYFTKPLQGSLLGINEANIPSYNATARKLIAERKQRDLLAEQSTRRTQEC
jgi:hypothetical protein